MNKAVKLQVLALQQGGFFTAKQAISCGYTTNNHNYYVNNKHWVKEAFWGLFSLPSIAQDERSFLWSLFLWSRDKNDEPQAIISHETALVFYELSEINPQKVHFTVPPSFQKTAKTPESLILHRASLKPSDVSNKGGLKFTTVLRTLLDIVQDEKISLDIIESAVRGAINKGLVTTKEIIDNSQLKRFIS